MKMKLQCTNDINSEGVDRKVTLEEDGIETLVDFLNVMSSFMRSCGFSVDGVSCFKDDSFSTYSDY